VPYGQQQFDGDFATVGQPQGNVPYGQQQFDGGKSSGKNGLYSNVSLANQAPFNPGANNIQQ